MNNLFDSYPLLLKIIKFAAVGASGMLVDFGVTYLAKEKINLNKYVSNTLGFFSAATTNFIFNRLWTFESSDPAVATQYFKFILLSIVGVMLSNFFIYIFNGRMKWNFYFAKLVSIAIVMFWNFFASYFFTFN
jgi:putative flippase GtrA